MAVRGARGLGRASGFHHCNGLAGGTRSVGRPCKRSRVLDPFEIQPEGSDPRVVAENFDEVFHCQATLVPDGE